MIATRSSVKAAPSALGAVIRPSLTPSNAAVAWKRRGDWAVMRSSSPRVRGQAAGRAVNEVASC